MPFFLPPSPKVEGKKKERFRARNKVPRPLAGRKNTVKRGRVTLILQVECSQNANFGSTFYFKSGTKSGTGLYLYLKSGTRW